VSLDFFLEIGKDDVVGYTAETGGEMDGQSLVSFGEAGFITSDIVKERMRTAWLLLYVSR
jgi:hypothetical protein